MTEDAAAQGFEPTYDDFVVTLVLRGDVVDVDVFSKAGGDVSGSMAGSVERWAELRARFEHCVAIGMGAGANWSETTTVLGEIGRELSAGLFHGDIRVAFAQARAVMRAEGRGVRVRIRSKDVALLSLPWELLQDAELPDVFLGCLATTPIARHPFAQSAVLPTADDRALRVLGFGASPRSMDPIRVDREERVVVTELQPLADQGRAKIDWVGAETIGALSRALADSAPHVLHVAAHGLVGADGCGLLIASGSDGAGHVLRASQVATLCRDVRSLRVVVLNACDGAAPHAMNSLARELVRAGVPVVIAMQGPIRDQAARAFAAALYASVARGNPIEAATSEARRALYLDGDPSFALPVLFLRAHTGALVASARGASAASFHVPFPHNKQFVGREVEIADLHALLQEDVAVGVCPTMLSGMGGIGKTQLAVEYTYAYRASYPGGVFWINATSCERDRTLPQQLQEEMARLALAVGLTAGNAPESERVARLTQAFAHYLRRRPDALVVFDNVEDPRSIREADAGFIPAELGCRVLFTTRRRDAALRFSTLEIRVLSEDAAVLLLLETARRSAPPDAPIAFQSSAAHAICRALGCLPLAVVLAGAYLGRNRGIPFEDYLERLAVHGLLPTIDATGLDARDLATRHAAAVAATLKLQWEALASVEGRLVLRVAALLGEAVQIPTARLALLSGLAEEAAPGFPAPLAEALSAANALCLVEELQEREIRLHPLVREFAERTIDDRPGLALSCATRLGEAYRDPARLEQAVARRTIDVVLDDLRAGLALDIAPRRAGESRTLLTPFLALDELAGALDIAAHQLRDWRREDDPALFLQQLRNGCFERGLDDLQRLAEGELARAGRSYLASHLPTSRTSRALVRTLSGHADTVRAVAITPDGRHAISASTDATLRLWDIASGRFLCALERHDAGATGVAVARDGRLAVSSSRDGTLRVWNLATKRTIRVIYSGDGGLDAVAVAAPSPTAIAGSDSGALAVWSVERGTREATLRGHTAPVRDIAVTLDGRRALTIAERGPALLWDIEEGRMIGELTDRAQITAVALSPDGSLAVTGGSDGTLAAWDTPSLTVTQRLEGHTDEVTSVVLTDDSARVISASRDNTIRIWRLAGDDEPGVLRGHSAWVSSVAVTPDRRSVVSASWDRTVKVWDLCKSTETPALGGHHDWIGSIALATGGRWAVSASADQTLLVWDLLEKRIVRKLEGHGGRVLGVAASGDTIISSSEDQTLIVWDLPSGQLRRRLRGHTGTVRAVALSADGRHALSASERSLILWDVHEERPLRALEGHRDTVNAVAITPDASFAVSVSRDETLRTWDLVSGTTQTLEGHSDTVLGVAMSSDGRIAASVSEDGEIMIWDLRAGELEGPLGYHEERTHGVAMSADGSLLVTASHDRSLRVWSLDHRQQIVWVQTESPLRCCAIAPDGRSILAGDDRGAVHAFEWVRKGAHPGA